MDAQLSQLWVLDSSQNVHCHINCGTYSLALNSYLTFCKLKTTCGAHSPTTELLCHLSEFFINPRSVDSYLSHIANQLKLFFPDVWSSELVACTLAGAKWCCGTPTVCKSPLTVVNLLHVSNDLASSAHHDNILFNAQLNSGFNGLLHLGGLTWPDKLVLHDFKKVTICSSSNQSLQDYTFWLPTHKADTAFEGNKIVVHKISGTPDPHPIMMHYIKSQDSLFPFHLQIWLKADGTIALLVHWDIYGTILGGILLVNPCMLEVQLPWWRPVLSWNLLRVLVIGFQLPLYTTFTKPCGATPFSDSIHCWLTNWLGNSPFLMGHLISAEKLWEPLLIVRLGAMVVHFKLAGQGLCLCHVDKLAEGTGFLYSTGRPRTMFTPCW